MLILFYTKKKRGSLKQTQIYLQLLTSETFKRITGHIILKSVKHADAHRENTNKRVQIAGIERKSHIEVFQNKTKRELME